MRFGVLALQGAFAEHEVSFRRLHVDIFEIRQLRDLDKPFDGMIIPGGESTVQGKLLHELGLFNPIKVLIENGMPVWGTCAGLLLLAQRIDNDGRSHLATMDITAHRNAYGRQLGSFHTEAEFAGIKIPMTFIRAPYIAAVGPDVEVLSCVDEHIVAAQQGSQLVTAFHPELDSDDTVRHHFIDMVTGAR